MYLFINMYYYIQYMHQNIIIKIIYIKRIKKKLFLKKNKKIIGKYTVYAVIIDILYAAMIILDKLITSFSLTDWSAAIYYNHFE